MTTAKSKTISVLLIEDNPDYAKLVQVWLSFVDVASFCLQWADSLQGGLSRLKQGHIDVVLLDLGLPDSGGFETFARTKQQSPTVPVILLSGDSSEDLALHLARHNSHDQVVYKSS